MLNCEYNFFSQSAGLHGDVEEFREFFMLGAIPWVRSGFSVMAIDANNEGIIKYKFEINFILFDVRYILMFYLCFASL